MLVCRCHSLVPDIYYIFNGGILCLESEDYEEDETCDTHVIEQTEKGFRCSIDVPSVLYK